MQAMEYKHFETTQKVDPRMKQILLNGEVLVDDGRRSHTKKRESSKSRMKTPSRKSTKTSKAIKIEEVKTCDTNLESLEP